MITNLIINCGLDTAIDRYQECVEPQLKQKNIARTSNDGLRLALILLDAQHRGSVSGVMSKKKDRAKSDVSGDPVSHFFEQTLTDCFLNPLYKIPLPPEHYYVEFPDEEKANWDPNDSSVLSQERTGTWLRSTWDDYVKPKHKKALDKWNKDTGGGDGAPTSFIDYCMSDRWLVLVFVLDLDANFPLACSAGGRMPKHLQTKSGFGGDDMSSIGDTTNGSGGKRTLVIKEELDECKKWQRKIDDTMEKVACHLEVSNRSHSPTKAHKIKAVAEFSRMMSHTAVLNTMSPVSREACIDSCRKE